jgi:hypothetical protein
LFKTELHGDEYAEGCEEEEGSKKAFSFLFFEYFGVTFVVVEDMGVNELGFTIVIIGAVLTLTINKRIDCDVVFLLFFYVFVYLRLSA